MKILFLGNNAMLRRCADIALKYGHVIELIAFNETRETRSAAIVEFCKAHKIPWRGYQTLRENEWAEALHELQPDLLVSVYNLDILPLSFLSLAKLSINFHDGPLPRYAGVNASSWAMVNGETTHGVTWHLIEPKIDTGPIIQQALFPIQEQWSILDLLAHGISVGCELFETLLTDLTNTSRNVHPQDLNQRSYYSRRDQPHGGRMPFQENGEILERLQRATAFYPFPNPFCKPVVDFLGHDCCFRVCRFRVDPRPAADDALPGSIISISEYGISFASHDRVVVAEEVEAEDSLRAEPALTFANRYRLKVGMRARIK